MNGFKRKKKICKECGREQYIYAKGLCQYCYIKQQKKRVAKKKQLDSQYGFSSEKEMFLYLWEHSDKRCFISGNPLTEFIGWNDSEQAFKQSRFYSMFAHVLPKGKYPKFRLNPENVVIVHPDIHFIIDFGTEAMRDKSGYDFSKYFKLKEQLKLSYEEGD